MFLLGALIGVAFTSALWHLRMARGYERLATMSGAGHIPDADEVAAAFGQDRPWSL
jgi:hypothetical protein